jgi:pyridoxamine 5'-phosphate oxidase
MYEGKEVARPEDWGGYVVRPSSIEFWSNSDVRFHDRVIYRVVEGGGEWEQTLLQP